MNKIEIHERDTKRSLLAFLLQKTRKTCQRNQSEVEIQSNVQNDEENEVWERDLTGNENTIYSSHGKTTDRQKIVLGVKNKKENDLVNHLLITLWFALRLYSSWIQAVIFTFYYYYYSINLYKLSILITKITEKL